MNLEISNETNLDLTEYESIYLELGEKTLKLLKIKQETLMSVTFVNKEMIHQINKEYRGIDRPTDVISFAFLDEESEKTIFKTSKFPVDLGEIYICYDVAVENAKTYGNSTKRELSFLFVHGLLHLLGYDHMTPEDEKVMFGLQDEILGDK